jgi:hypothetical protein
MRLASLFVAGLLALTIGAPSAQAYRPTQPPGCHFLNPQPEPPGRRGISVLPRVAAAPGKRPGTVYKLAAPALKKTTLRKTR